MDGANARSDGEDMSSGPPYSAAPTNGANYNKRIRAKGSWQGAMRTTVTLRGFEYDIDEPSVVGGTDTAPTPMEYVIGALNGCVSVVVEQVAKELGFPFSRLETYSIATQDTRGFAGTADVSPYFHSCRLEIHVETQITDAAVHIELLSRVNQRCPAINLIEAAIVDLDIHWVFDAQLRPNSAEDACNAALGYTPKAVKVDKSGAVL
ncbi:OsmC family protein [Glutamicibacter creatinolyticus]|uniref:OsmC family protein n=1 Tax=Glutamicibacter creatinolyticus TaxID=162496 RepID=UPI0037BE7113